MIIRNDFNTDYSTIIKDIKGIAFIGMGFKQKKEDEEGFKVFINDKEHNFLFSFFKTVVRNPVLQVEIRIYSIKMIDYRLIVNGIIEILNRKFKIDLKCDNNENLTSVYCKEQIYEAEFNF
ncbi:hypothetical protein NUSPORA_01914 [Nucleospora cyclopteri]